MSRSNVTDIRQQIQSDADQGDKPDPQRTERSLILDAAVDEVCATGVFLFSLEAVAKRANLSLEQVRQHFVDRQSLLFATADMVSANLVDAINAQLHNHRDDPFSRLLGIVRSHFNPDICPTRYVTVWSVFLGATGQAVDYQSVLRRTQEKIFASMCECIDEILARSPNDIDASAADLANAIYGAVDRHWKDGLPLRPTFDLGTYYDSAFESVKSVIESLFERSRNLPEPGALASLTGREQRRELSAPDPSRFDRIFFMALQIIDESGPDALTPQTLASRMSVPLSQLTSSGNTWDSILCETSSLLCEDLNLIDYRAYQSGGPEYIDKVLAVVCNPNPKSFGKNRCLFWHYVSSRETTSARVQEIGRISDRFTTELLSRPIERIIAQNNLRIDVGAIVVGLMGTHYQNWLKVRPDMSDVEFLALAETDSAESRDFLRRALPAAFGPQRDTDTEKLLSHRERIFDATCHAATQSGLREFTYSEVSAISGIDEARIERLFGSRRELIVATFKHYVDQNSDFFEEIINDQKLTAEEIVLRVIMLNFDSPHFQPHIVRFWNLLWANTNYLTDFALTLTGASEMSVEYFQRALHDFNHTLGSSRHSDETIEAIASSLYGLMEYDYMMCALSEMPEKSKTTFQPKMLGLLQSFFPNHFENSEFLATREDNVVDYLGVLEGSERRARILQACSTELNLLGDRTLVLEDIAKLANVTPATVRFHFNSFETLVAAVVKQRTVENWTHVCEKMEQAGEQPEDRLVAYISSVLDPEEFVLMGSVLESPYRINRHDSRIVEIIRAAQENRLESLAQLLDAISQQNDYTFDVQSVASSLHASLSHFVHTAMRIEDDTDRNRHLQAGMNSTRGMLKAVVPGRVFLNWPSS